MEGSERLRSFIQLDGWGCLGLVHWDDPEGGYGEGGGFRMGNTCIPVVDSFRYLAKLYNIVKFKNKIKFKKIKKKKRKFTKEL